MFPTPPSPAVAMSLALHNSVAQVLTDPKNSQIDFSLPFIRVTPELLRKVGVAVAAMRIQVVVDPKDLAAIQSDVAYEPGRNTLILASFDTTALPLRGGIVHEAVHAAIDMERMVMTVADAEVAAFVAQAIYIWTQKDPTRKSKHRMVDPKNRALDQLYAHAAGLAEALLERQDWQPHYENLLKHILAQKQYRDAAKRNVVSDGI